MLDVVLEFRDEDSYLTGKQYVLYQNVPNPFSDQTVIGFELPEKMQATVSIYDVAGKVLRIIEVDGAKGYNEIEVKRIDLKAAGVLYYQLDTEDFTATKRMILID